MMEYINTPIFGVGISIIAYAFATYIVKRTRISIFNPLLVATLLLVGLLLLLDIDYETYNEGGRLIAFFLGPATVVLAVPLYRQRSLLKDNLMPIIVGITVGSATGVVFVFLMGKVLGLDMLLIASLLPKSTTTPIAIEISTLLGGDPSLTTSFVIITGISGYILGEKLLRIFRITDPIAKGIAFGTSSHAVGTAKALEMGEVEGAMSSLAIGVAGIVTVFFVPVILKLLSIL